MKLAILTSHPIQYYAPWFRHLAVDSDLESRVFYLWDFGVSQHLDVQFQQSIQWDIDLLSGYDWEFVPNTSAQPGTSHFWGLQNPSLVQRVQAYHPDAVLLMNYNYASLYRLIWQWHRVTAPLLFRGDSHRLVSEMGWKANLKRQWITQIYRRFAACLYVGQANYTYFREHGVAAERLFFSPHAVESDRFGGSSTTTQQQIQQQARQWQQELGIPTDHAVVLFAGKFITKKRPLDLLEAFLQAHPANTSLLFVGAGELEPVLRQQAAAHPHVYFAPFQNQSQMPRTYAIADLVVLPSYGPGETWGLAINEAMGLGKAVMVSNHVGCATDLVHPGQNGLIFPAGNVSALAEGLRMALGDRDRLSLWGQASREIIANYSYHQTTQGLKQALAYLK